MFADTFMSPPCPILQALSKLVVPSLLDKGTSKFSPFLVRLSVDLSPPLEGFDQMPYDFFCPSVQSDLKKKVCPTCGIYFTSHKIVQMHFCYLHSKTVQDHSETRVLPEGRVSFSAVSESTKTNANGLKIPKPSASDDIIWAVSKPVDRGIVISIECYFILRDFYSKKLK